ncbi:microtubule organization protein AKNA isoform X1 [Seriola aureovittata]|uniref:microtubule organization protein AKNA isoform X1 n=1 Tax=Seriola aureovittata TaxID=2871759 RepID=UPI0024BD9E8B|nr:microtubule organization protein AKNA isoform X1 [Seriola aureovittata]XP_056260405.1 microtubule organization protein AKNA isoform X1 [Seriola aureovittata]
MEIKKNTKAGILFWTPAPAHTSSTSSVISEDEWEDEDEEQAGKEDDFGSQMDDNGIIGLSEAMDNVELGKTCGDADAEYNPTCYSRPLTPEEADASGHEGDTPPGEWNYTLSEHLSLTEAAGEDVQILSPCDGMSSLKAQTEGEEVRQRKEEHLSNRDTYLDMTEEEKVMKRSDSKRKKCEQSSTLGELGATKGLAGSSINKDEVEKIRAQSCVAQMSAVKLAEVSNHHCPVSQPASVVTATTFPHLLHFTAEEIAAAPGIEAETFPEMGFIESYPESHSSHMSLTPSPRPRKSEKQELKGLQTAAVFPEQVMANCYSGVCKGPLKGSVKSDKQSNHKRKMSQPSSKASHSRNRSLSTVRADSIKSRQHPDRELMIPSARTKAAEVNESRNGPLSYRTPDFSQVEPRVHFPKGGYKPPKSRRSPKRESLSPEPPIVFKSPADIVKEVLLNTTDGCPPSDSNRPPVSAPNSTVPQEFRCRHQATTLLEQLQEDYNRLLTKYAEAENTIDRLRLEAKVNLYSEAPKPGHLVQSGLSHVSNVMTLDFAQAQRAEINSASPSPNGHSAHQILQVGQQLAKTLYNQADKFLQQLHTFEDLLKRGKLKPFEQMKGLSQLAEGLNSLERGYLLARDELKLLQQRGAEISHFDPERELEGLIYQCGLHMDELREQVEQMRQEQPTCEAPPSPPPQPMPLSVTSERGETLVQSQCPPSQTHSLGGVFPRSPVPLLAHAGRAAEVEVSSAREESDEEEAEMDDEDSLSSLYLKPVKGKHRHVEQDFDALMDHYQNFKDLPKMFDQIHSDIQPGDDETEGRGQGTGHMEVQKSLPQRVKAESDHQESAVGISKQRTSKSSQPSHRASSQSTLLSVHPPSSHRRLGMGKSHSSSLSSLGEITAPERRNSKLQTGSRRVLSQDGIISPETDSGFVGSESSNLTPAAAPSPLHQRASQSASVHQEGNTGKHQTGPVSAPSPASSRSHSRTATESRGASQLGPDQPNRRRQSRRTFSCAPQRWVGQMEQTRADSGASEFGLESDSSHIVSDDGQSDQYAESIPSLHISHPSSSPTVWYYHGDSLRAMGFRQLANRNDTIQTLQAEVTTLKDRLESCLSNKPFSPMRAAPSAQVNYTHHFTSTPRIRPEERCQSDDSRGRRERRLVDEVEEESRMRRTARERSPCVDIQKPQRDICSEPETPTTQSRPRVSRCTQTSTAAPDSSCSHTNTTHSKRTRPRQHPAVSIQVPNRPHEPDSRNHQAPVCLECSSCHRGRSERPGGGNREPTHSSSHCPHCGRPEPYKSTKPDCRRDSDSPTHTSCQPAKSHDRAVRNRYAAAPPALLQCMPVCPPPLLMYSLPLHVSPSNSTGTSSGVKGHEEVRGRMRRSLSTDKQHTLDTSLNRAIKAAQNMKHTSRHMARSLATGLQYQELLTQSYSC